MRKVNGKIALFVVCMIIVGMMVGCGSNSGNTAQGSQTSKDSQVAATVAETKADSVKTAAAAAPKVAVILKALANEHWVAMKEGFTAEAKAQGIEVDIYAVDSEDDMQGQLKKFEDALGKDYQGICFAPISPVNLIPTVVQANKKGITIVNYDEQIDMNELKNAGGSVAAFVTTDNTKIGEKAAKLIVDKLGASGGEVAIIEGKAGNATSGARKTGAENGFKSNPAIKVVGSQPADWDRTKALDVATNMIQRNPNLKAFYCCNDTMALGVIEAVKNTGKAKQIIVVGTDGVPEAIKAVNEGTLAATVAQDPKAIAATTLKTLIEAMKNKTASGGSGKADAVMVDSKLVTK